MKKTLCFLILASMLLVVGIALAEEATDEVQLVYSRIIDVPGVGEWPYYAQNDPLWSDSIYEPFKSDRYRIVCETGCGAIAGAIALSRQLAPEELPLLLESRNPYKDGFEFCPCSINGWRCNREHEKQFATTVEDFQTYLPVIVANYAAGNNTRREKFRSTEDGTSIQLYRSLAEAYGLHYIGSNKWDDAVEALKKGYSVVTTVTKGVFTPISHFLVIANIDEEYVYDLDPYMRESYAHMDKKGLLEVIEPGLVRAKLTDLSKLRFSGYYMFRKPIPFGRSTEDVPE